MRYYTSENHLEKPQQLVPFWLLILLACISSLGVSSRFLFADAQSLERLVKYNTKKIFTDAVHAMTPRGATLYVHAITEHCHGRDLAIWENWVQWLLGQFYSPLLRTQDPRWIVSGGKGDCSERSALLQDLLKCYGMESRLIGLGGHVVLEVQHDQQAWVLDPDYGISLNSGIENLQTLHLDILVDGLMEQGLTRDESIEYGKLIRTTDNNITLGWNAPLSPRLKQIELWCEIAVWLLPIVCWICVGWAIFLSTGSIANEH
jgi:hypothetical protein